MGIKISDFGKTIQGVQTHLYTVVNKNGIGMEVSDYGASLVSVTVQNRNGGIADVVLGYDEVCDYETGTCYLGACIGRIANRVKNAEAMINGNTFQMEKNEGENGLHSGSESYSKIVWEAEVRKEENAIRFYHSGKDGEQGLPGNFDISVTYTLTDDNAVGIHYEGISDKDTMVNMTNHAYFNLAGHDAGSIEDHILQIDAEAFTPVAPGMLATGEIRKVEGTPMDFTAAKKIGRDIGCDYEQLEVAGGYDHNYVLRENNGNVRKIAEVIEETSGRRLEVLTDTPCVQFYAGNFLSEEPVGKEGILYGKRTGFCLETQCYPDAGHHPEFPSCILKAGEKYDSTTIYRFSVL